MLCVVDADLALPLTTPVNALRGVGEKRAAALRSLGIRCLADLILHLPLRYEIELPERAIAETDRRISVEHGAKANTSVRGEVLVTRVVPGRRSRFEAQLSDGTGTVRLTWFNAAWLSRKIHPGMRLIVTGKAKRYGDQLQITNPQWRIAGEREPLTVATDAPTDPSAPMESPDEGRLRAIYPANELITSRQIEKVVRDNLSAALRGLDDHLPEPYRRDRALPTLADSYRMMHEPRDEDEVAQAQRRLAFDELLLLQLAVMMKRRQRREQLRAMELPWSEAIDRHIRARLPFSLTASQDVVVREIAKDLAQPTPMNRLLQGDVGAGKTAVALYAMLQAVAARHQAALMAPTELLAEQHYQSVTAMLDGSKVSIALLTGSLPAKVREARLAAIAAGEIDLVIGTHALLTETVQFKSLSLAVIDEQHRFGVHQRSALRDKSSDLVPHVLVMTATPIPRTLSLTVFGDLDVSIIHGLPPGRSPIVTRSVSERQRNEVYDWVAKKLIGGEQAYIVVPVIDETESGLRSVEEMVDWLARGPLKGRTLAAMHGRVPRDERESIMHRFRAGEIDALIATTVIEVGVDVPNATIMVIEHAERFGLAQLHQLRGRVGRGAKKSFCVLIADPSTEDGIARVNAIVDSTDGFVIAERDLEIRGPGDVFGTRQSGIAPFRVAVLPRDSKLLDLARRDATAWIERDPDLAEPDVALLRKRLLKAHGELLGLGDVA